MSQILWQQELALYDLGETGFSVECSEGHALKILENEACAINADLVVINEETRPDVWSSCYRCTATFYKLNMTRIPFII